MIIQHYDFAIHRRRRPGLRGETYFGFFHPEALADQVGIREATPYRLTAAERAERRVVPIPDCSPFPDVRWRMIDRVEAFVPDGGPHGLGFIEGSTRVDPGAWFFKAHFLRIRSGRDRWGWNPSSNSLKSLQSSAGAAARIATFESPAVWTSPTAGSTAARSSPPTAQVTAQAVITGRDDERRWLKADGFLMVDGRVIYQMNDFTLRLVDR